MVRTTLLERLYKLDKTFAVGLDKALHDEKYISQLTGVQEDELIQVMEYLSDTIRRLIYVGESPRKCLHILHRISSTRKVLPRDYEVSGTLSSSGGSPSAHGGSSEVHRGTLSAHNEDVCIKLLRIYRDSDQENINELLCEEAIIWKHLSHPNIVPFKGVTLDPPQLVSEWIPGGELREYIKDNPSANLINLLLDVAYGLEYLHAHGVIHGDLKGPNILVDACGNARITDFGLASIVRDPRSVEKGTEASGYTPRWTAPEIFLENITSSKESDIFSFAMVAIEVFSGEVPFHASISTVVPGKIMNGIRPDRPTHPSLTEPLWSLIRKCWNQMAKGRPKIGDVIKELKGIEYIPPPKQLPEEPPVPIPGPSELAGYDMESPLPGPSPLAQRVNGQGDSLLKKTNVIGGGIVRKPALRAQLTTGNNDLPTNDFEVEVEEEHGYRVLPKETNEVKDRKALGRKQSRRDPERDKKSNRAEEAAREVKAAPEEGPPNPSGITTASDPWIDVTSPSRPTTPKSSTQPPPKVGKGPPASKETKASGGGIMDKPLSRYPPKVGNNDPPASGSRVTAEEQREHRTPPQETREKDRRDLGVRKQSRKDLESGRKLTYAEMAAKARVTPKEEQPDPSGSTTALPLQTNAPRRTTPGPSTQPPLKVGEKSPPTPNETRGVGGGITNKSATRLPLTVGNNSLASDSKVTLEEGREPHVPPKVVMEDEDRKELGRKQSRRDRRGRKQDDDDEGGAKRAKGTPDEGPLNASGSATAVDPGIVPPSTLLAHKPSSRRNHNTAIPPMPGSNTHINIEQPFHPLTLPPNLEAVLLPTEVKDNQSGGQNSEPSATPPMQDHHQMDNLPDAPLAHPPTSTPPTTRAPPEKSWWKCLCCS